MLLLSLLCHRNYSSPPSYFVQTNKTQSVAYSLLDLDKAVQSYSSSNHPILPSVIPHESKSGSSVVIVQERHYTASSTYRVGSSTSRSLGPSSGYNSSTMDSSPNSRSSSASTQAPDRTGTYRNGAAGMTITFRNSSAIDTNTTLKDGYVTDIIRNTMGKREVVIVHHNRKDSDPDAPRTSDRRRA